jgi:hypothetical protein
MVTSDHVPLVVFRIKPVWDRTPLQALAAIGATGYGERCSGGFQVLYAASLGIAEALRSGPSGARDFAAAVGAGPERDRVSASTGWRRASATPAHQRWRG